MLVSEQVGAMETVSLSHPITMHNANVYARLSAASHLLKQTSVKSGAKLPVPAQYTVQFKSLLAGLQYFCCYGPTEALFVILFDY